MDFQELKAIWQRPIGPASASAAPVQPDWSVVDSVLRASGALDEVCEPPVKKTRAASRTAPRAARRTAPRAARRIRNGRSCRRSEEALRRRRLKRQAALRARNHRRDRDRCSRRRV